MDEGNLRRCNCLPGALRGALKTFVGAWISRSYAKHHGICTTLHGDSRRARKLTPYIKGRKMTISNLNQKSNPPDVCFLLTLRATSPREFEIADLPRRHSSGLNGHLRKGPPDAFVLLVMSNQPGRDRYARIVGEETGRFLFKVYRAGPTGVLRSDLELSAAQLRSYVRHLRRLGFSIHTQGRATRVRYVLKSSAEVSIRCQSGTNVFIDTDGAFRAAD